ncbi:MAG: LytTR family DNA-binding domain-containing protein [Oscillospiraceae bacterium]
MKISVVEEPGAQKEVVIRCNKVDDEVRELIRLIGIKDKRLAVEDGESLLFLEPSEVLYCEYVNDRVFFYTEKTVYPAGCTLAETEETYSPFGFFRCSKSMVVNLRKIVSLKSEMNGRIIATVKNGERIIISRHYSKLLRWRLNS